MDAEQQAQEAEYELPYHYLPRIERGNVVLYPHWSWGFRYLGGIELLVRKLREMDFGSLIDVGCGDGRLLRDLAREFPGRRLAGLDYSHRAIGLARALNPGLEFLHRDLVGGAPDFKADVVTLIEVLEHIETSSVGNFVSGVRALMSPSSLLVVTVPHKNDPLNAKHYRHYDSSALVAAMEPYFSPREVFFFDRRSRLSEAWHRLMCNKYFIVRHRGMTNAFYRHYLRNDLTCEERDCLRLGAVFIPR